MADASFTGGNGQDWKPVRRIPSDIVSGLPFSSLLSQLLVAFAVDYEEMSPVALSLSTAIIRRILPEGYPARELNQPVGVSALLRHGFLCVNTSSGNKVSYLTSKGLAASSAYEKRVASVEIAWRTQMGERVINNLRRQLEARRQPNSSGTICG